MRTVQHTRSARDEREKRNAAKASAATEPTTPCSERSKQNLADCGISMFTTYEKNPLRKISNCTSHITIESACIATSERVRSSKVRSTTPIQTHFLR